MNNIAHSELLNWYSLNRRNLPWRETKSAYAIWLSEVILQQTRVDQGLPYFQRFLERYPDIYQLANAPEEEVLKLWQGLGYYSRARNMLATAKLIATEFGGEFPKTSLELRKLKGIGPYTAAAVASFAFNEAVAVLDGNVFRVLSRIWNEESPIDSTSGRKRFELLAKETLNKDFPDLHNQAMMELGALVCKPNNPDCMACPIREWCLSFNAGTTENLPVKSLKTKVKERHMHYFFIENGEDFLIGKRSAGDIWQGLYDLPEISFESEPSESEIHKAFSKLTQGIIELKVFPQFVFKTVHLLSHRRLIARFYHIRFEGLSPEIQGFQKAPLQKILSYPASRLFEKFQENYILQERKQE